MTATLIKDKAHSLVNRMPENSTWDDLIHEISMREASEQGLADSKAERPMGVKEVRAQYGLLEIQLPLDKMTVADKIKTLEAIWESLKGTPKDIPVPAWHDDVLKARELRIREGASVYGDWADAKSRIRERTR